MSPAASSRPSKTPPLKLEQPIMDCPVCAQQIVAKVEAEVSVVPTGIAGQAVTVDVSTLMTAFNVEHSCPGPVAMDDRAATS